MSASKRKREEPKAPVSQSKQAYVEDEDMSTVVYRQGLEGCDQLILSAYSEISKPDVEQVARELSQAPDEETKNQAKRRINEDEEIRKEFINRILKKWEEKLNKPPSKDEVEERRTYCLGYYGAMVEDVFSHAEKMAAENKGQHHRGQAMRDEINRILKALGNGASHYDLLEVPRTATTKEIESAYKRKAPKIHSDKNDDEEATKCFQGKGVPPLRFNNSNIRSPGKCKERTSQRQEEARIRSDSPEIGPGFITRWLL